ncbi:MAG: peptidyl-prolyl cis-trans isomerase A (cyclophilin A) [Pseudohongiellaceae bacterium]|jgi:peptidyl-prolyl cis-trans isomerase A (cyclophilin A)
MKKLVRFPLQLSFILLILLGFSLPARAQTIVCMETTFGEICMELLETDAPITAQNFLAYVSQGSYRNSIFHFSKKDGPVYIQAGRYVDVGGTGIEKYQEIITRPQISNETSVSNTRGTVAMVPDDPNNPDSATSQFIINISDNSATLDNENGGYTVFARIIGEGLTFADLMSSSPVASFDNDGLSQVPVVGQEIPVLNSPTFDIFEAGIFDGDITDFENEGSDDGDPDGEDGDTTGGDDEVTPPTPGEGETLYEDAVCVDTNAGEFCMELLPDVAPNTVANFLNYISSGRYDDTLVHRSVPNFVIQGGGYSASPLGASIPRDAAVVNEFEISNLRGTVAMARAGGQVNSATSEWFVNVVNNTQLDTVDGGFTVFARIISGMPVVDAIAVLPRVNLQGSLGGAFGELPLTDQDTDGVDADDVVLVNRIYVTDVIVDDSDTVDDGSGDDGSNDGTDDGIETTAEYSTLSNSFYLPVRVGNEMYRVIMVQDTSAPGVVFSVITTRIFALVDSGQDAATMDLDAGTLIIPSVKVGNTIITDVEFSLTEFSTLTFTLQSFNRP